MQFSDPQVWENGPVLLICADKIQTFCDGTVTVDQGSIGKKYSIKYFLRGQYENLTNRSIVIVLDNIDLVV